MRTALGGEYPDAAWVGFEKNIPTSYADSLTRDSRVDVRCAYADHPSIPSWALAGLRFDPSPIVLACAAGNKNAPYSLLEVAMASKDWAPRQQACGNPNLPDELLLKHYSKLGWVEFIVLVNKPNVPKEVLLFISQIREDWRGEGKERKDWNEDLRNRAKKRLGIPLTNYVNPGK